MMSSDVKRTNKTPVFIGTKRHLASLTLLQLTRIVTELASLNCPMTTNQCYREVTRS